VLHGAPEQGAGLSQALHSRGIALALLLGQPNVAMSLSSELACGHPFHFSSTVQGSLSIQGFYGRGAKAILSLAPLAQDDALLQSAHLRVIACSSVNSVVFFL